MRAVRRPRADQICSTASSAKSCRSNEPQQTSQFLRSLEYAVLSPVVGHGRRHQSPHPVSGGFQSPVVCIAFYTGLPFTANKTTAWPERVID